MKKTRNKNKKIIWGVFILIILLISGGIVYSLFMTGIPIETALAEVGQIIKIVKATGTVESESSIQITAKNNLDVKRVSVEEGEKVEKGQLLLETETKHAELDLKSLKAELAGLKVRYDKAKELSDKNSRLYEQGALSYEEYDQALTAVKELQAQITALNYSIESYSELSGVSGIRAPIEGYITGVYIRDGEHVIPGALVFEISNLDDRYIKVDLIAEDADLVSLGDQVHAYNKNSGFSNKECYVRKIHMKAKEIMSDLGLIQKRVTIEIALGSDIDLRLGSDVEVEINIDEKNSALCVPEDAVFEKNKNKYIYVVQDDKAILREVETGIEGEEFIEIINGLKEGEEVILSPGNDIIDGTRVRKETE